MLCYDSDSSKRSLPLFLYTSTRFTTTVTTTSLLPATGRPTDAAHGGASDVGGRGLVHSASAATASDLRPVGVATLIVITDVTHRLTLDSIDGCY